MWIVIWALIGKAFCGLMKRSFYARKSNLHNQMHLLTSTRGELERGIHQISETGIIELQVYLVYVLFPQYNTYKSIFIRHSIFYEILF